MKLEENFLDNWTQIVNSVDKKHCPVSCVKKIIFRTSDKKQKTINFQKLRNQGFDNETIESLISDFIFENQDNISNMELVLDIEAVAEIIQPETDKLLKGI